MTTGEITINSAQQLLMESLHAIACDREEKYSIPEFEVVVMPASGGVALDLRFDFDTPREFNEHIAKNIHFMAFAGDAPFYRARTRGVITQLVIIELARMVEHGSLRQENGTWKYIPMSG